MIYLIITTSINNRYGVLNDEIRKSRYIDSISSTLKLIENDTLIKPIIVENNGLRDTYLKDLKCDVVYTNNNSIIATHKGINELMDIKHIINKYEINDDDFVIKLTGRYKILNDKFFSLLNQNTDKYDVFIKFFNVCTKEYMYDDCVLGLLALKCKYFKDFEYDCIKSPEVEIATYIRSNIEKEKIMEINDLALECSFADDLRILVV